MGVYVQYMGQHFHVDNMACAPHDHHFTTSAWELTWDLIQAKNIEVGDVIKEVSIWSDGGLKTKENLRYFQKKAVEFQVDIFPNFYGPYHGHNKEDGHFGRSKQKMRQDAKGGPIVDKTQVMQAFQKAGGIVQEVRVAKNPEKVKAIKGQIRKWFSWKLTKEGKTFSREFTGEGEWVENPIELIQEEENENDQGQEKDQHEQEQEQEQEGEGEEKEQETEKQRRAREKRELKEEEKARKKAEREAAKEIEKERKAAEKKRKQDEKQSWRKRTKI